jgi:uncharacterized protein (TIGR00297 family)
MLALFFILGTTATSWKMSTKQKQGIAERDKGKRTAGQVIANAGVAGIAGLLMLLFPHQANVLFMMLAASFASATADTLSSELGNVYGSRYYNILTFKQDSRGLNGVISVEGTLIGLIGSAIIAVAYTLSRGWGINFVWIILAGTVGNLTDSVLGATLERRHYLGNNAVNFLNTLVAAITALLLSML